MLDAGDSIDDDRQLAMGRTQTLGRGRGLERKRGATDRAPDRSCSSPPAVFRKGLAGRVTVKDIAEGGGWSWDATGSGWGPVRLAQGLVWREGGDVPSG